MMKKVTDYIPDSIYLRLKFKKRMGKKLNLKNPITFNEKLQWLKLYDRNPEYITLVDKYRVRDYIAKKLGEEYLIPLIGVWDSPDEIDFDKLPDQFVLKCNHNSGLGLCICKDKSKLDIEKVKSELKKGLQQDYYLEHRECPYKEVPRKIICEKYMTDSTDVKTSDGIKDYKFLCFNGKVKYSFVCSDRFSDKGLHVTFFDRDWNVMPFERHYPSYKEGLEKPRNYDKMVELAEELAGNTSFVRVDFYEIEGRIYFGEYTLYPGSGFEEFSPEEWDKVLGDLLELPKMRIN